ncbi:Coq4 family protein [Planctomycetota bacterium]|nr:Coq4 family protein [Planctomycetota bacterium]
MNRLQMLAELFKAVGKPERIGDVAAFKAGLIGGSGYREVELALEPVRGRVPHLDLSQLESLPAGSFGREYARFMSDNRLSVIAPTEAVPESILRAASLTIRYGVTHDMFHVLTGFDASWPGEVGVWAFVGGQRYSRSFRFAAWLAMLVAPLLSPLRVGQAWRNWHRGWSMGQRAKTVIAEPLEDYLEEPVASVRQKLGIEAVTV